MDIGTRTGGAFLTANSSLPFACSLLILLFITRAAFAAKDVTPGPTRLPIYTTRESDSDLEVTGMVAGLPAGATGYVRYSELASLPTITVTVRGDENFSELNQAAAVRVTGVYLQTVEQALGSFRDSDLIDATCSDGYRAHYPAEYITAHHPILALTINRMQLTDWALHNKRQDLGPYLITHDHFVPSFRVLAHAERPQVPTNVVRLNFSTEAATYGAIMPRGNHPPGSPEQQGFEIAKQNCLRCHNQGPYGGIKAGRTWMMLSTWAVEQPAYFSAYVHNPKTFEAHAKMPGNPEYDAATLAAITAYFRTFTAPPAESTR
jgi:mono/diheme cytochrome c family protein